MRIRSFIIFGLLITATMLSGQIVTVKSAFSVDSAQIGEQIFYTLSAEAASNVEIEFPVFSDTISGEIEILDVASVDTTFNEQVRTITHNYRVTSFTPGWNTIPPQAMAFKSELLSDTAYTPAVLLTVLAPVVDTTQAIKPIKPPMNTPVSFAEIAPIAAYSLGGLLILALITYLIWRFVKKRKDPEGFHAKPLEPADIVALRELDHLKEAKLPQNGQVKQYYTRLTGIVRYYITRQFEIPAMESTTDEIIHHFDQLHVNDKALSDSLKELLLLADLVKFAKEDPLMKENEMHMGNAVSFVHTTQKLFEKVNENVNGKNESKEIGGLKDE